MAADWGSRRTNLVLIGMGLDEARLRSDLEACVLTDDEMVTFTARIQAAAGKASNPHTYQHSQHRFKVGAKVDCFVGPGQEGWLSGEVVAHDYTARDWPSDEVVAYLIRLADGSLTFAPIDSDDFVRSSAS